MLYEGLWLDPSICVRASLPRACVTSDIIMLTLWLLNKQTVELSNIRQ